MKNGHKVLNFSTFLLILAVNILIGFAHIFLDIWPVTNSIFANSETINTFSHLVSLILQYFITRKLLGNNADWLRKPFSKKAILIGTLSIFILHLLVTVFAFSEIRNLQPREVPYRIPALLNFIFYWLPGALYEEWLYRYFPLKFAQQFPHFENFILICFGSVALFALVHYPSYVLSLKLDPSSLWKVFYAGIVLLLVFIMTKNLIFTSLTHAFLNDKLFIFNSPNNWIYFYLGVLLICSIWAVVNWQLWKQFIRHKI